MVGSAFEVDARTKEYFGQFGGFYVPDPFTPALDDLDAKYKTTVTTAAFASRLQALLDVLEPESVEPVTWKEVGAATIYLSWSRAHRCAIAGHCALAEALGAKEIVAGIEVAQHALDIALLGKEMGVPARIVLSAELSARMDLVSTLEGVGCEVDTETCGKLFNIPVMYAFQKWIANPGARYFVPTQVNVGPYPFPSITGSFCALSGQLLRAKCLEQLGQAPASIFAACRYGTTPVGALRPFLDDGVALATVEERAEGERLDSFCGALVLVVGSGETERIISPELAHWWETGKVRRCYADGIDPGGATDLPATFDVSTLSPASVAAVATAEALAARQQASAIIVVVGRSE